MQRDKVRFDSTWPPLVSMRFCSLHYHNINYYADFLFCQFGRRFGFVITPEHATSISAGIDGGQPWRRTFGENVTYTDWSRDNYFHAVRNLVGGAKRIGIEFDPVNIDLLNLLKSEFPVRSSSMWRPLPCGCA